MTGMSVWKGEKPIRVACTMLTTKIAIHCVGNIDQSGIAQFNLLTSVYTIRMNLGNYTLRSKKKKNNKEFK